MISLTIKTSLKRFAINCLKKELTPRGVEISSEAVKAMLADKSTRHISMNWGKETVDFNPYSKRIDLWKQP